MKRKFLDDGSGMWLDLDTSIEFGHETGDLYYTAAGHWAIVDDRDNRLLETPDAIRWLLEHGYDEEARLSQLPVEIRQSVVAEMARLEI